MENFDFITDDDKSEISYKVCVGGMALTGIAIGGFAGLEGLLIGGIAGTAYGLVSCKKLSPIIKSKLFSTTQKLSDREIIAALEIIKELHPKVSKKQAMVALAKAKEELSKNPAKYKFV